MNANWQSVYGGSNLLCVRGGWEMVGRLAIPDGLRLAVTQARTYDEATSAYPGFVASRRNYDVGEGIDVEGDGRGREYWKLHGVLAGRAVPRSLR